VPKKPKRRSNGTAAHRSKQPAVDTPLRIIGGHHGGRKLRYSGDPRTRPMKDRVREAVFNLVGPAVRGKRAVDLFAGTGALGLEAISRGAAAATFFERHFPTAAIIRENAAELGVEDVCDVIAADTFLWFRAGDEMHRLGEPPLAWVVFCSPPFDFYTERLDDMLRLVENVLAAAPPESIFVVEADQYFDFGRLPRAQEWDVRAYSPAFVGILRMASGEA